MRKLITLTLISGLMPLILNGQDQNTFEILFSQNFENTDLGYYRENEIKADWNNPAYIVSEYQREPGYEYLHDSIVVDPASSSRVMKLSYKAYWPQRGGDSWSTYWGSTEKEVYFSYNIKFRPGFDFADGGKLPGIGGGQPEHEKQDDTTLPPNNTCGFRTRLMWNYDKRLKYYSYHENQPSTKYASTKFWDLNGGFQFTPGEWTNITMRFVMNTYTTDASGKVIAKADGIMEGFINGELKARWTGVKFMGDAFSKSGFERIVMDSFFGGTGDQYTPNQEEWVYFDDFYVFNYTSGTNVPRGHTLSPNNRVLTLPNMNKISGAANPSSGTDDSGSVDNQKPTAPTNLKAADITHNSVYLSWAASKDNVGVEKYRIYANGLRKATVGSTSYTLTKLNSQVQYDITVTAIDAAANESDKSAILKVTTLRNDNLNNVELSEDPNIPEISFVKVLNSVTNAETVTQIKGLKSSEILDMGVRISQDKNFITGLQVLPAAHTECQSYNDERVSENLQLLYNFAEGSGNKITDISQAGEPVNLYVKNTEYVNWLPGQGMKVTGSTVIQSDQFPERLVDAFSETNEITLEAWIKPESKNQTGPARIVTFSTNNSLRAFTLGQEGTKDEYDYVVRLNTSNTDPNGIPEGISSSFTDIELHHVVYTRTREGIEKLFVNGVEVYYGYRDGNISSWANTNRFAIANEISGDRPWNGTYYLVAAYNKALNEDEIIRNFEAGFGKIEFKTRYDGLQANSSYYVKPFVKTDIGVIYGDVAKIVTPDEDSGEKLVFNSSVYPNPSTGDFTVFFENNHSDAKFAWIRVMDITGKLIYSEELQLSDTSFGREEKISLNPEKLQTGIYFLTITIGKDTETQKLMINK